MAQFDLVAVLGPWPRGTGSLHRALAEAFGAAIRAGEVPAGIRLPSERALAQALAISRGTVVAAYALLRDEQLIESRRGSGSCVVARTSGSPPRSINAQRAALARAPFGFALPERPAVDLATGAPRGLGVLDRDALTLRSAEIDELEGHHGYAPLGLPSLRARVARHYTNLGLSTSAEEVLITTGAQQAIALAAGAFLERGDVVLMEDPTYFGAVDAFRTIGARMLSVASDEHGIDPRALRDAVIGSAPRLVYVMPIAQNPTGTHLPDVRRRQIARIADEFGVPIIEDETLAEIELDGERGAPIARYARAGDVVTIGSLSKLIWPGLRVGWLRAPGNVIARMARIKVVMDLGSSPVTQAIAARMMDDLPAIKARHRATLQFRLELLEQLLRERLPDWSWRRPAGGFFLWIRLPYGDSDAFAQVALRHRVMVMPGSLMSPSARCNDRLRLPFIVEPEELREGIARLASAWGEYAPHASSATARIDAVV